MLSDGPKSAQYSINATYYGNLRRLPEYQNITTSYDHFLSFGGSVGYANRRASLGAVDYEKGFAWRFSSANRYVNRKLFSRVYSTFDIGVPLPLGHSSVWLRNAGGYSPNKRIEPLANFYFGGFGNNWVDHGTIQRYRSYYSFPGTELNAIAGVNFVRSMVDWSLPPLRFRRLGIPSLYVSWARMALFSSGIVTNIDSDAERTTVGNIGAQVDFRLTLLSHLRMTFSVGYATAYEKNQARTDEFMASLQVL